jgi:hypothetical protein
MSQESVELVSRIYDEHRDLTALLDPEATFEAVFGDPRSFYDDEFEFAFRRRGELADVPTRSTPLTGHSLPPASDSCLLIHGVGIQPPSEGRCPCPSFARAYATPYGRRVM